jgi:hypothetical protein
MILERALVGLSRSGTVVSFANIVVARSIGYHPVGRADFTLYLTARHEKLLDL